MTRLSAIAFALSWLAGPSSYSLELSWAPGPEPITFIYFSHEPRPKWCDHPDKCGDWPEVRVMVKDVRWLNLDNLEPGTYYVGATTSYNQSTESDFGEEFKLVVLKKENSDARQQ